jgi:hypothetical protein
MDYVAFSVESSGISILNYSTNNKENFLLTQGAYYFFIHSKSLRTKPIQKIRVEILLTIL